MESCNAQEPFIQSDILSESKRGIFVCSHGWRWCSIWGRSHKCFSSPPSSVFFTLHWGSLSKLGRGVFGTLWALIINVISYVSVNLTHTHNPPMLDQKQCWWSKWMSAAGHLCSPRRQGASYINYSQHQKVSLGKESGSVLWNHYNDLKICSGVLLHNWGLPRNLTGLPRDHKKWEPIVSQLLAICCRFKTLRSSALYDTFFDREEDFFYF